MDILIIGVISSSSDSLKHQIGAKSPGWTISRGKGRVGNLSRLWVVLPESLVRIEGEFRF